MNEERIIIKKERKGTRLEKTERRSCSGLPTFFVLADCFCLDLSDLSCCELLLTLPGLSLESALRLGGGYKKYIDKATFILTLGLHTDPLTEY